MPKNVAVKVVFPEINLAPNVVSPVLRATRNNLFPPFLYKLKLIVLGTFQLLYVILWSEFDGFSLISSIFL